MNSHFSDVLSIPSNPEDLFYLTECLGHGAYGHVFKGIYKETNMVVAIKIINYTKQQDYESLQRETSLMKMCEECPYIVKYYGSYCSRKKNQIWIICEYCDCGSTIDLLCAADRTYTECEIATIMEMTLKALVYLHSHSLIHRDVKGANIMLNSEGYAKLGDFGVGIQLNEIESMRSSKKGSPYWMSPQVVTNSEYDTKTDIWSLGITCFELCEGEPPMSDIKPLMVMKLVAESPSKGLPENNHYSKDFNDFVKKCLTVDPYHRPSASELLTHPFIKQYSKKRDYIKNLVKYHMPSIAEYRQGLMENDKVQTMTKQCNNIPEAAPEQKEAKIDTHNKQDTNEEVKMNHNSQQESFSSIIVNDDKKNVSIQNSDNGIQPNSKPDFLQYISDNNFIFDEKNYFDLQNKKNDQIINQFLRKSGSQKSQQKIPKKPIENNNNSDYNNNQTLTYFSTNTNHANYSLFKKYRNDKLLIGNLKNQSSNSSQKANCIITDSQGNSTLRIIDTTQSTPPTLSFGELILDKEIANKSIEMLQEKMRRIKAEKQSELEYIKNKTELQISKVSLAIELLSHFPNVKTINEVNELIENKDIQSTDFKTAHMKMLSKSVIDDDEGAIINRIQQPNMNNKHKQYFKD